MTNKSIPIAGSDINSKDDPFMRGFCYSLFVSGCKRRCKGCQNPGLQSFDAGFLMEPDNIVYSIKQRSDLISSVAYLGGDWINYPEALKEISRQVSLIGLNILNILYTGELFENIDISLLEHIDIVVDGEYDRMKPTHKFPTSSNQRVWVHMNPVDAKQPIGWYVVQPENLPINNGE